MTKTMARKSDTPRLSWDELLDKHAREGESLSDTIVRMFESGDLAYDEKELPDWMGSFEGPGDLSINLEKYLGIKPWGPGEKPGEWPNGQSSD